MKRPSRATAMYADPPPHWIVMSRGNTHLSPFYLIDINNFDRPYRGGTTAVLYWTCRDAAEREADALNRAGRKKESV